MTTIKTLSYQVNLGLAPLIVIGKYAKADPTAGIGATVEIERVVDEDGVDYTEALSNDELVQLGNDAAMVHEDRHAALIEELVELHAEVCEELA